MQTRSDAPAVKSMWFAEVDGSARAALGARLEPFIQGIPKWTPGPAQGSDPFHDSFAFSFDSAGSGYRGTWTLVRDAEDRYREAAEDAIDDPAGLVYLPGSDRTLTGGEAREALKRQLRFTTSNQSLLPYVRRK